MVINELSVNGAPVDHFFDVFGNESFDLETAVEFSVDEKLVQLTVEHKVVIDVELDGTE